MGVYPLLEDETCWFLAVDLDKATWKGDVSEFVATCRWAGVDRGEPADPAHELVGARRRVTGLACLLAHEARRVDILAAAEQRPKQAHLLCRRLRPRGLQYRQAPVDVRLGAE